YDPGVAPAAPGAISAAAEAAGHRPDDGKEDNDNDDDRQEVDLAGLLCLLALGRGDVRLLLVHWQRHLAHDLVGASDDAAAHVAGLEPGHDRVADNASGQDIGQESFST